jgi:hypothetical protein
MISVLTITYKRHHLLEEAMQSFLLQDPTIECEMVIINDNSEVDYVFDHPNVRILNCKNRFPSIAAKLEWGYKQCKYDYIYRLDDDDLLAPNAMVSTYSDIIANPGYEIYRSSGMYFFVNNLYDGLNSNVNNGNVYTKEYLDRITFPDKSGDEDADITFSHNAKIYESKKSPTMIYRWGMNTLHISGMGKQTNEVILAQADKVLDNNSRGTINLVPRFKHDYYEQINRNSK